MKPFLAIAVLLAGGHAVNAQVNTVITDGTQPFAEGVLEGYEVQADGRTLCRDPIAYGRYVACNGRATKPVWVETNGVLGAYIVVDQGGRQICEDPSVWKQFRGQGSVIVCP